jgi:hypothetical protein
MRTFLKTALAVAITSAAWSSPASAQFQQYEDYEISDAVWEMTTVKVDPGQIDTYLEGLNSTWVAANDVAKELGHIEDYAIYGNMAPAGDAFDLVLMIKIPSTAMMGPSRERYDQFMEAWGEANMDRSNETVTNLYNQIREIQGTYLLREIMIK